MNNEYYCFGCGIKIQNTNPSELGYTPLVELTNQESILCKRCYDLQHHNKNQEVLPNNKEFLQILATAAKQNALVVLIIDLFNFESSMISSLRDFLPNNKFLIIGNKRDLIPLSVKDEKIKSWLQNRLKDYHIHAVEIILASALKLFNIDEVLDAILHYHEEKNVYVIGNTNVGKSSIINALIRSYSNETTHFITTSYYPNTTLKVVEIPLGEKTFIYDTPGLVSSDFAFYQLDTNILKYILPKKEIKPVTYQLNSSQSIYIGGLARLDFIKGKSSSFTFYFSRDVVMHRCKAELADEKYPNLLKNKQFLPISENLSSIASFEKFKFSLTQQKKVDIVIQGYGFISVEANQLEIEVLVPIGAKVIIRTAMI